MKVWVLTKEYNMYDQQGAYFEGVYNHLPTPQELWDKGVPQNRTKHVQQGGGRVGVEDEWFNLEEFNL